MKAIAMLFYNLILGRFNWYCILTIMGWWLGGDFRFDTSVQQEILHTSMPQPITYWFFLREHKGKNTYRRKILP